MRIKRQANKKQAFTLTEVIVAMVIIGIVAGAVFAMISFNRIQTAKDKDRALVLDFCVHYLELAKGLPFEELRKSAPINRLFDGSGGGPNIRFPASTNWISVTGTDYLVFHPELVWLMNRNPQMRVDLQTTQASGMDHSKHLILEMAWDAPLNQGSRQHARLDMIRTLDVK